MPSMVASSIGQEPGGQFLPGRGIARRDGIAARIGPAGEDAVE
jgi:hypothetical protein